MEALAKAGLLERVMEVVQEADEEDSGVSGTEEVTRLSKKTQQPVSQPSPTQPASNPIMFPSFTSVPAATQPATQAPAQTVPRTAAFETETEPTREELVQTPASEFATPPSTPPDTPTAEDHPMSGPWPTSQDGVDTPKQKQIPPIQTKSTEPTTNGVQSQGSLPPIIAAGPLKQTDTIIIAGAVPVPTIGNGPPVRLESLSALSTFDPHLVSRSLQGTALVLALHDLAMVFARLTWNNWANYEEVVATPVMSSVGTESRELRRYHFSWSLPPGTNGADVQLALRMENGSTNQAHWDNNNGQNYFALLSPIQKRTPTPSITTSVAPTPTASGVATPTSAVSKESATSIPPRVYLVRTESDNSKESNVLYDPNRRSIVVDGQVMNVVPGSEMHQSAIPFPSGPHPQQNSVPVHNINIETASTGSSYSVPTPTASVKDGISPSHPTMNGDAQKQLLPEEAAAVERAALNTSLPPSRTHSISSRASGDSSNAPFHYPSRAGAYQASALQQQSSLRRRVSRDMQATPDMPNIMTAIDNRQRVGSGPDDLSGIYVSQGRNISNTSIPNDMPHSAPPTSDAGSISARSQGGMSVMTVPSTQRLNTKMEVKPFSMSNLTGGKIILPTSNSTMRALTLTSNATQTLGRSFWRNNTQKTLRQNPKLPDHLNGKLGSSATITYSNLTPVPHKVRGDECLVQVFACAIDFWDRAKVEILHTRGQGYGFVPGRAFVGKVLECGDDVDPKKVKRGDFVYGLADLRKVRD